MKKVTQKLDELKLPYKMHMHEAVLTVEALKAAVNVTGNTHIGKNLFIKDKKHNFFIITASADAKVNLKTIGKMVGAQGDVRFADEKFLDEKLHIGHGSVSPFAAMNAPDVKVFFDSSLQGANGNSLTFPSIYHICNTVCCLLTDTPFSQLVLIHPLVNTASVEISFDNLQKFLAGEKPPLPTLHLSHYPVPPSIPPPHLLSYCNFPTSTYT